MQLPPINKLLFLVFTLCLTGTGLAQVQAPPDTTSKLIRIIKARNFRQQTTDSASVLITLSGDAVVQQGRTTISGDSIVVNQQTGIAEVFGNVHINDADSVHTYAGYLKYIGNERVAYLKQHVKLTDGKAVLTTNDLEYNIQTGIARYSNGGKVINGTTTLTSTDAVYLSDTKDVFFKNNVHLTDPKSDIIADSLRYNTYFKEAYFISPTRIKTKNSVINTSSGTYNIETGNAVFLERTSISDSTHFLSGDKIASDEKSGMIQIEGKGKLVDSANSVTVLGDQILLDRNANSFLATRKPVMIFYKDNDSTYVAADTLFSGLRKYDTLQTRKLGEKDTLQLNKAAEYVTVSNDSFPKKQGMIFSLNTDSSIHDKNDRQVNNAPLSIDSMIKQPAPKDSIRYFIAFHHVRIYNDSLQAVSDSLHYSTEDSTFKLFYDPVFWNNQTQVNGDTMYLFTENRKAKRLYVFNKSLVVNKTREGFFNQMGGRTLNGYFKEGVIDYIRIKGTPAESIFYPQDEDSAYVGMNRSSADVIDIFFIKKELDKVTFVNDVNGTMYPLNQIPADEKFLRAFDWKDKVRPKNKLELFE